MSSYLEAVKKRLEELNNKNNKTKKTETTEKSKFNWFKPKIGQEYEVRFLPYLDKNNQPFEEVLYYNKIHSVVVEGKPKDQRIVAPFQYGLEDPIASFLEELHKSSKGFTEESKTIWKEWNKQRAKERFYSILVVRDTKTEKFEEKGPQLLELSNDECMAAYNAFTHKDLVEEDVFDPNKGFDFTLSCVADPGKTFNGGPVRKLSFTARRKSTKLGTKEQMESWLNTLKEMNLNEYFKNMAPNVEKCRTILENYLPTDNSSSSSSSSSSTELEKTTPVDKDVDKAFKDLEDL